MNLIGLPENDQTAVAAKLVKESLSKPVVNPAVRKLYILELSAIDKALSGLLLSPSMIVTMQLVIITGPPAVGKMTVGKALAERTGLRLFHNHMSIRLVLQFFEFGTPGFSRLDQEVRFAVFREIAQSDLPGLIFTLVWDFDDPEDHAYVAEISEIFTAVGGEVQIVELEASLTERLVRNKGADRLREKPSKRDLARSEEVLLYDEQAYRLNSKPAELSNWRHLKINNEALPPAEVAATIQENFNLPPA